MPKTSPHKHLADDGSSADHPLKAERYSVPALKSVRETVRAAVREYVRTLELVPPLSMEELRQHTDVLLRNNNLGSSYRDFITVLVGNEVWWNTMAGIPFERRVLMLPQCLRTKADCPAVMDELGLLCEQCGRCPTGDIQEEAEDMGYVVLVAEGTTVVTKLLEQGKVDAVIGVSCLSVLERAFPHLATHAIPGIAIPLVRDGCENTQVDLDWVREAIHLKSDARWLGRIDIERLRINVETWFMSHELRPLICREGTETEEIALDWLAVSGKRWRPVLAACVYKALTTEEEGEFAEKIHKVAVAMECFHKASLAHDDIEDADELRYGRETLHKRYGVPIALNVGDLLLGEGYRLIAECGVSPAQTASMLGVVADAHRNLCLGQGEELCWMRNPTTLSSRKVLDLFRRKTAPAFEVALRLGAICADAGSEVGSVLKSYSESLGIAFQIRDDLEDYSGNDNDTDAMRPSILHALAYESAAESMKDALASAWKDGKHTGSQNSVIRELMMSERAEEKARQLLEHYKNEAIRSLGPLRNAQLKSLLRRIVGKIVGSV
jgi:geranylgeranyl diphosphate synthase, type II